MTRKKTKGRLVRLPPYLWWSGGIGVLFGLAFFALSILQFSGAEYMGVQDQGAQNRIVSMFKDTIILSQLKILLIYLVMWLGLGVAAGWWHYLLARILDRGFNWYTLAASVTGFLLATHLIFLLYGMTVYPQLFIEQFYNSTAPLRQIQRLASDLLPLTFYKILATLWLTSFPGLLGYLAVRAIRKKHSPLPLLGGFAVLPILVLVLVHIWGPLPDTARFDTGETLDRPDVLVLAADSIRPDYMAGSAPPGFAQASQGAVVFKNAYAPFPRTFPSWMSMLSGRSPAEHGIRHMFPALEKLADHHESLPHILAERGYQTAVVTDYAGDIFGRIDLGFQHVDVPGFSIKTGVALTMWKMHVHLLPYLMAGGFLDHHRDFLGSERRSDPRLVTDRFFHWLSQRDQTKPYFAVLFYSVTHFPYSAPYPFYRNHSLPDYVGPHRYCKVGYGESADSVSALDIDQIRRCYLGSIDAWNAEVSRVLNFLADEGRLDNTLVILTSDHGENLYERGKGNSHGEFLRGREALVVPYIFKIPGLTETLEVETPVATETLAPTILGLLGMATPDWMEAQNLAMDEEFEPDPERPIFGETGLVFLDPDSEVLKDLTIWYVSLIGRFEFDAESWELFLAPRFADDALLAKHRMIIWKGHKLIYIPTRQGVRLECFDHAEDPDDEDDIYTPHHEKCSLLREKLYEHMAASGDGSRIRDFMVP